jgi:hypothetical protein
MSTKNMPATSVRSSRFSLPKKLAFLSLVLLGSTATVGCNALTSQVPGSSNAIKAEPAMQRQSQHCLQIYCPLKTLILSLK